MKKITLLLLSFALLVNGQQWTQKRVNMPAGTYLNSKYTPANAGPSGIDTQTFLVNVPEEHGICGYLSSASNSGGEWGNGVYCYHPELDDKTSTSGNGTGWTLLNSSGNAQKNGNGGVTGLGGATVSISCSSGVVTVNVSNNSAQFLSDGVNPDGREASWVGVQNLPSGWANGMHKITSVSNPKAATHWEDTRLFQTYTWADATCPNGTTLTGSALTSYVQSTVDELPDQPQRGHREAGVYDGDNHAIWIATGILDNNIDATTVNAPHSGSVDLYKMTKTANGGANWEWFEGCGFGSAYVGVTNYLSLNPNFGPGHLCGQQFITTSTTNVGVNGLWCLDYAMGLGGGISTSTNTNCGLRMAYAGYDQTNHVMAMFGGSNGGVQVCATIFYYPATDTWKSLSNAVDPGPNCGTLYPNARWNQASSRLVPIGGGKMLLFGGSVNLTTILNDTWILQTCASNNIGACGWTKITSTVNPPADNGALNGVLDWAPSISKVVYVDTQSPSHIWYFDPTKVSGSSCTGGSCWSDQGTGSCDAVAGCPTFTQTSGGNVHFSHIGAVDQYTNQLVVFDACSTATVPSCTSTKTAIWTLDLPASGGSPVTLTGLTTQEQLPNCGACGVTRTNEVVTVGLPLADAAGINNISGLGCSGSSVCQFRSLATWNPNIKWVQFDYIDSLAANTTDTSVSLSTGTGNVGSNMATDNGSSISVNTGTGGCTFVIQKANHDGLHTVTCNGRTLVSGGGDGLRLMGPTYAANASGTVCTFGSTCNTKYSSALDSGSTCSIEENGPVRVGVKCLGGLKDSFGNKYMGFLVRYQFYVGKERVKLTATLKNADDGAKTSFPVSYKAYQSFGFAMNTQLTGTNTWTFGNDGTTNSSCATSGECTGSMSGTQKAYLYQGYSTQYLDTNYNGLLQYNAISSSINARDINTNSTATSYAQDGYVVVNPSGTTIFGSASTNVPTKVMGFADVKDFTGGFGVAFGTPYMQGNFPRSLEINNGGKEIFIGISPDQSLWPSSNCTAGITPCSRVYYQPWPYYKVVDGFLMFHDSDSNGYSETGTTRARNDFVRMQAPLVARAPIGYYNESKALPYVLVLPADHQSYYGPLVTSFSHTLGTLTDKTPIITRAYDFSNGGGDNQHDIRYDDGVTRWLEYGFTGRYTNTKWFTRFQEQYVWPRADNVTCVVGGITYHGWPCHTPTTDLNNHVNGPSSCNIKPANLCNDSSGMLPNNCTLGAGCAGGYVMPISSENSSGRHYHWWHAIYHYYMTGDEDVHDLLTDVASELAAVGTNYNYTTVTANGNLAKTPDYNRAYVPGADGKAINNNFLSSSGSYGGYLTSLVHYWRFLADTGSTQDANFVDIVINNELNVMTADDPCATTGVGSGNQNWPSGCIPRYNGSGAATGNGSRGFSAYRGILLGPGEGNDVVRCGTPATGQDVYATGLLRCAEPFLTGYLNIGILTLLWAKGTGWTDYNKWNDLNYGAALNEEQSNYLTGLANSPLPANAQLVYTMAWDQPNDLSWQNPPSGGDGNGPGPPMAGIYRTLGFYTGSVQPWKSHWENTFINLLAGSTYAPNSVSSYASYTTDPIVNRILYPPTTAMQTVCSGDWTQTGCGKVCGGGNCTLSWAPPSGVTQYYLKKNDTKTIVENIGWNTATNQPIDPNVANDYNWFALGNTILTAPSLGASSITVAGTSTTSYMLKAVASPQGCTIITGNLPAATVGQNYAQTLVQLGCNNDTWTGWTSCHGLTLDANTGILSGTVTGGAATCSSTVTYDTDSKVFSVTVNAAPTVTTNSLVSGTRGVVYSAQTIAVTGGTSPIICTGTGAPAGMSINTNCTVSGTPTVSGSFTLSVTATDTNLIASAVHNVTLTIAAGANTSKTGVNGNGKMTGNVKVR